MGTQRNWFPGITYQTTVKEVEYALEMFETSKGEPECVERLSTHKRGPEGREHRH